MVCTDNRDLGVTVPSVGSGSALVYEAVMTGFLMFVIMAVATDTRALGAARDRRHGRADSFSAVVLPVRR